MNTCVMTYSSTDHILVKKEGLDAGRSKWDSGETAGERGPEAYPLGYVEDLLEPRTKPGTIFSVRWGIDAAR